jgi:hypothetical protein
MNVGQDREQLLAVTFVELADTLVADFDVVDFLHGLADRAVQLLDVDAAGLMLADPGGRLHATAASSENARLSSSSSCAPTQDPASRRSAPAPRWSTRT